MKSCSFNIVSDIRKGKTTVKFQRLKRALIEDTKRFMPLESFGTFEKRDPGARFSKVPELFGRISGDINPFVSSKLRRLEARNFVVFFSCFPFTSYEKTSFAELVVRSFTNGFSGPKSFRDFQVTGPRDTFLESPETFRVLFG